jgi:hypothetical protein
MRKEEDAREEKGNHRAPVRQFKCILHSLACRICIINYLQVQTFDGMAGYEFATHNMHWGIVLRPRVVFWF